MSATNGDQTDAADGRDFVVIDRRLVFLTINLIMLGLTSWAIDVSTSWGIPLSERGTVILATVAAGLFVPTAALTAVLWFSGLFGARTSWLASGDADANEHDFAVIDWRLVFLAVNLVFIGLAASVINVTDVLNSALDGQDIVFMTVVAAGLFVPTVGLTIVMWVMGLPDGETDQSGSVTDDSDDGVGGGGSDTSHEESGGTEAIERDSGDPLPQRDNNTVDTATQGGFAVDGWGEDADAAGQEEESTSRSAGSLDIDAVSGQSPTSDNQNDSAPADVSSESDPEQEVSPDQHQEHGQSFVDPESLESSQDARTVEGSDGVPSDEDSKTNELRESDVRYQQRRSPY